MRGDLFAHEVYWRDLTQTLTCGDKKPMAKPLAHRDLSELRPNPRNPRRITEAKRNMLRDALARFGDISGVVYNRRSKQLVGGHQRCVAFTSLTEGGAVIERTLDAPSITGTVAEGYVSMAGERFAYREVDWDEQTEMAANLAANKGAGEWDLPEVASWMQELNGDDFSLNLTMFDEDERAKLVAPSEFEPSGDAEPRLDELAKHTCPKCGHEF